MNAHDVYRFVGLVARTHYNFAHGRGGGGWGRRSGWVTVEFGKPTRVK
jgi:hypothetical protein